MAVLLVTVVNPLTSPGFIDRFTVTAQAYNIPLLIVFNKVEIYDKKAIEKLEIFENSYLRAGYETMRMSVLENLSIDTFIEKINKILPNLHLKTGEISATHNTGKHTTTFAEMFDFNEKTQIIDTPGIKGFGLVDFDKSELSRFFPEMFQLLQDCKFHNCKHINEPGCEVLNQLSKDNFSITRHQSYLAMYSEDKDSNYRKNNYLWE